jgi:hypothetical protein
MTTRVFDFQDQLPTLAANPAERHSRRTPGFTLSVFAAFISVPLAGASEAPAGWFAAALTAVLILSLAAVFGERLRWGWIALLAAGVGLGLPRGPWGIIGPPLFVATLLCVILWLARRDEKPRRAKGVAANTHERTAQQVAGLTGEREVGRLLATELPQDYALINGLQLPRAPGDIDHLVVGPTGVFLLETKTMAGHITCAPDGTWQRTRVGRHGAAYAAYIGDPAAQVQRNIFALRQALRRRLPDFVERTQLWIEGLVVFPHPKTELQTDASRVPTVLLSDTCSRICTHVPRRRLRPSEVDAIVAALLVEAQTRRAQPSRQTAQALVELALVLPVVLLVFFGTVGVSRYVQTNVAVVAVAHVAARAGALASSPPDAVDRMRQRTASVATGLGLDPHAVTVSWDLSHFNSQPGLVDVTVEYPVDFGDVPIVGGMFPTIARAEHVEWVDPFRSGVTAQASGSH